MFPGARERERVRDRAGKRKNVMWCSCCLDTGKTVVISSYRSASNA